MAHLHRQAITDTQHDRLTLSLPGRQPVTHTVLKEVKTKVLTAGLQHCGLCRAVLAAL